MHQLIFKGRKFSAKKGFIGQTLESVFLINNSLSRFKMSYQGGADKRTSLFIKGKCLQHKKVLQGTPRDLFYSPTTVTHGLKCHTRVEYINATAFYERKNVYIKKSFIGNSQGSVLLTDNSFPWFKMSYQGGIDKCTSLFLKEKCLLQKSFIGNSQGSILLTDNSFPWFKMSYQGGIDKRTSLFLKEKS